MNEEPLSTFSARVVARDVFFTVLLVVPLFVLYRFDQSGFGNVGFILRAIAVLFLAAAVGVAYRVLFHRIVTPAHHPKRPLLLMLLAGIGVMLAAVLFLHVPILYAIGFALALDLLLLLLIEQVLVLDAFVAAVGMGMLYLLGYLILNQPIATTGILTLSHYSGSTLLSHPVEELSLVFLLGMLWGPLASALRKPTVEHGMYEPTHHNPKKLIAGILAVLALGLGGWAYDSFVRVPKVLAAMTAASESLASLDQPITINFDRPISPLNIHFAITPDIPGEISFASSKDDRYFVDSIVFTPSTLFAVKTEYVVELTNLKNVFGTSDESYRYAFTTPDVPVIQSVTAPTDPMAICDPFKVEMSGAVSETFDVAMTLSPDMPFTNELSEDRKTYLVRPNVCLSQATTYTLTATRVLKIGALEENAVSATFTTKAAPGLTGITPQGSNLPASTNLIQIGFSVDMKTDPVTSQITLEPQPAGSWNWKDAKTVEYSLTNGLALGTTYTITVRKGMPDAAGGFLEADAIDSFSTIGAVRPRVASPGGGATSVAVKAAVRMTFDQPVEHKSAEEAFSINPNVAGSLSWSDETLVFTPQGYDESTTYTVSLAAGIVSKTGLPSKSAISSSFQTVEREVLLNVPQYHQERALSCELSSLRMALAAKGVNVSETTLVNQIGTDTRPRQNNTWGDPDEMFVGDINGKQNSTGYGVHAAPIATLARQYRSAEAKYGMSIAAVTAALDAGDPIVIWGTAGTTSKDSWTTFGGRTITTWVGEHARVIAGYRGKASNPSSFLIRDPIFGTLRWTPSQLLNNWGMLNNMAVVVH